MSQCQSPNRLILQAVTEVLVNHIEPLFKPGIEITLAVRTPGNEQADLLVTTEQVMDEIVLLVERSKGRPPEGVQGPKDAPQTEHVTGRKALNALYLEYVNNYLTVEKFAEHQGLTTDQGQRLIELAREIHNSPHPEG